MRKTKIIFRNETRGGKHTHKSMQKQPTEVTFTDEERKVARDIIVNLMVSIVAGFLAFIFVSMFKK
jgi:DNA polymerase IIIc chi subunit